jgi:tetratricopeptide (TPR) repeat protein
VTPRLRVFLSSPADVGQERLRAHLVIQKLARDYARFFSIESFLWEYEPMLASKHFQDTIDPPGSFDIVVLVLWSRLGTVLPEKTAVRTYRGIDGRTPVTGTEWEFEDALRENRARGGKGPPDLLVYRRIGGAVAALDDAAARDEKIKQYEALEGFWRRWFETDAQFLAGYAKYTALEEFDRRVEADLAKLIERRIKDRSLAQGAPLWLRGSPFRGLAPYGFADARVFFGRDGESREGMTRLAEAADRGSAWLLVTGPSGTGKSSLARAGLLPSLVATKAVTNVGMWRRVVMRPGDAWGEPVLALARALVAGDPAQGEGLAELAGAHTGAEELAAHLAGGGDPGFLFAKTLRELADAGRAKFALLPHEEARLVLLIDQLEELFTRREIGAEQRARFAEIVAALARSGVVWVIATMRSDLIYRLDEVRDLGNLADQGARLSLTPPDTAQLLEIIRQAARAAGLTFDTDPDTGLGLDAMLAGEAAAEPGVLPLLSVMLDDLYGRDVASGASGGVLTVASYRALGGLRAAIGERAERHLLSLEASDMAAAQALPRVLRALVATAAAGDTLAAQPMKLATFTDGSPERRLVEALLAPEARLLTIEDRGRGSELRLAHEALIENWPRAKQIVTESGHFIRVRDDIEAQRRKWEIAGRRSEFLLARGLPLAEAEDLVAKFGGEMSVGAIAFVKASRGRARRRQQLASTAAVVFGLVALVAVLMALVANRAQRQAVAERYRAEQTLSAATLTANQLVFDLAQRFRNAFGIPSSMVRDILQRALALQRQLTISGQLTPELQFSEADALAEYAKTLLIQGDTDHALDAAQQANALLRDLLDQRPDNLDWRHDLTVTDETIGDILLAQGKRADALAAYRKSLAAREQLISVARDNTGWQRDLVVGYFKIGDALVAQNQLQDALVAYREGLAIIERFAGAARPDQSWQRHLAVGHERLGGISVLAGKLDGALTDYRESLDIRLRLIAGGDDSADEQRDLSVSYERIGDVLAEQGTRVDAASALQDSPDTRQRLVGDGSSERTRDAGVRDDPGGSADDKFEEAVAAYQKAIEIRERLTRTDENNSQWQGDLSVVLMKVGDAFRSELNFDKARSVYARSLAIAERLTRRDSDVIEWARDVYVIHERMGDLLLSEDRLNDALAAYQNSLAIRSRIVARNHDNAGLQRDLGIIHEKIGDALLLLRRDSEALDSYQHSLEIRKRFAERDRGDIQWQRDLTVGYLKVGDALVALRRRDDAIASYRSGLAVARGRDGTESHASQRDLGFALSRAGVTLLNISRPAEALTYLNDWAAQMPNESLAYFDRARAELYAGQVVQAADDLATAVKLEPTVAYFDIWLHLARARAGQQDDQELASNAEKLSKSTWPSTIVELFLQSKSPSEVLDRARLSSSPQVRRQRLCEATFYAGEYQLEKTKREAAAQLLKEAVINCPQGFIEQAAAKLELQRLGER